jgi:hypothetical protein
MLAGSGSFNVLKEFKQIIPWDPESIARNLLNKTLTYDTGAEIQFADRREIDRILEELKSTDYGFRSLIHAAVQSSIFLSK